MSDNKAVATRQAPRNSLIVKIADQYGVDADKMLDTLKATAFKVKQGDPPISNEQMMALLVVADQYHLNPFTREIYAFPDKGGIVPVVGVDGWSRIINEHPQMDGVDFTEADDGTWIDCTIYRKDRTHPTKVREWFSECKRGTGPWQSHPRRMLRHKALIQCARVAFGFVGIYDQDEAERIREADDRVVAVQGATRAEQAKAAMAATKQQDANSVNTVGVVGTETPNKPSSEQPKQEVIEGAEGNSPRGTTDSVDKSTSQPGDNKKENPVQSLEAGSIERLKAAKTRKELRTIWGEVIDDYDKVTQEIPLEVEDVYNTRLDFLTQ